MLNLIYRLNACQRITTERNENFILINKISLCWQYRHLLVDHFGAVGFSILCMKILTGRRYFFFLVDQDKICSCGVLSIGFCQHYPVSDRDIVIGSIWTDPEYRGQGLATLALIAAMNHEDVCKANRFYIDTQANNVAMQRAIEKAGFGHAVGEF